MAVNVRPTVMAKYVSFGTVRFATMREYVGDFLGELVLLPAEIALTALVWQVIYSYVGTLGGFTLREMIAYQMLVSALGRATGSVRVINYHVWQDIRHGKLDVLLVRPVDYQMARLAAEFGEVIPRFVMRLLMLIPAFALLGFSIPTEPGLWAAFLLAAAGGVVVLFLIQFMIATMGFWLEAIFGFRDIIVTIDSLFAGRMIPLSALPGLIATISQWLPFQFTLYVPVAIYMGKFSSAGLFGALGLEALWIAVLFGASRLLWRRGLVKYASQGG